MPKAMRRVAHVASPALPAFPARGLPLMVWHGRIAQITGSIVLSYGRAQKQGLEPGMLRGWGTELNDVASEMSRLDGEGES